MTPHGGAVDTAVIKRWAPLRRSDIYIYIYKSHEWQGRIPLANVGAAVGCCVENSILSLRRRQTDADAEAEGRPESFINTKDLEVWGCQNHR